MQPGSLSLATRYRLIELCVSSFMSDRQWYFFLLCLSFWESCFVQLLGVCFCPYCIYKRVFWALRIQHPTPSTPTPTLHYSPSTPFLRYTSMLLGREETNKPQYLLPPPPPPPQLPQAPSSPHHPPPGTISTDVCRKQWAHSPCVSVASTSMLCG